LAPIDNNACERSIRPIAIGRNNWLFAGSMRGGRAAAVLYTLIESCKRGGVDVLGYLADVLVRDATHPASKIDELLPANWAKHFAATASA
ncbi:MAG: transposase domain-containing protein, partial [Planctomycetota bacterium]